MILFIMTIDSVLTKLADHFSIIAYADDILLSVKPEENPNDIINFVEE